MQRFNYLAIIVQFLFVFHFYQSDAIKWGYYWEINWSKQFVLGYALLLRREAVSWSQSNLAEDGKSRFKKWMV